MKLLSERSQREAGFPRRRRRNLFDRTLGAVDNISCLSGSNLLPWQEIPARKQEISPAAGRNNSTHPPTPSMDTDVQTSVMSDTSVHSLVSQEGVETVRTLGL